VRNEAKARQVDVTDTAGAEEAHRDCRRVNSHCYVCVAVWDGYGQ